MSGTTIATARRSVLLTLLASCSILAEVTVAQTTEPAATGEEVAQSAEIIVTARRRDESLLEIPVAITALNADAIEARGIGDMVQLSDFTPGYYFNNSNLGRNDRGFTTLTFRGMDAGTFLATRQPAQAFMDGLPIVGGNIPGLDDIERVEVIKGPQSAYFGRSTFSGAINFITKNPSYDWSGRIKSEVASYGTVDTSLSVEGGLIPDRLAMRITGRYYTTDGQYENAANSSERLGARSTKSLAGTLFAEPADGWTVKAYLGVWQDKDGPAADTITGSAERNCDPLGLGQNTYVCGSVPYRLQDGQIGKITTIDADFRRNYIDNELNLAQVFDNNFIDGAGLERKALQATLSVGYEFPSGISIDVQGGYNKNDFQVIPGVTVVGGPLTPNPSYGVIDGVNEYSEQNMFLIDQGNRAAGGEVRVASPGDTRFRWMIGASYYWQQAQGRARGELNTGPFDGALITDRDVNTTGVFTGLAFDITDALTLNLEGRYQWDRVNSQVIEGPGGAGATEGPVYENVYKTFQPRAILEYKLAPEANLYASFARGYRPGDFNANLGLYTDDERRQIEEQTGASSIILDEEKLDMFELGLKGRFFDGLLRMTLAGYYGDWTNIHVFNNIVINQTPENPQGTPLDITTSSGDAKLWGAELEGALNLTDSLTVDFTYAYTRVKLGSAYSCSACQPIIGTRDVTGNQKARVPKTQGTVGVTYSRYLFADYDVMARVDYIYKGNIYASDANLASTGAANRVNAALTLRNDTYSVTLFATNLFNDKTFPSLTPSVNSYDAGTPIPGYPIGPGRALTISLPEKRVIGIRTSFRF